ncbi:MAG: DUF1289 domain-containing protein [Alphaproteobacteria bacterium]|nr:MAG: DUF1289 domain-containing protein [Alphaproteobacteria bacterium]
MKDEEPRGGVASPCVKVCVVHPDARICVGCRRTLEEIAAWGRMSDDERLRVLECLPERASLLARRRGGRARRQSRSSQAAAPAASTGRK